MGQKGGRTKFSSPILLPARLFVKRVFSSLSSLGRPQLPGLPEMWIAWSLLADLTDDANRKQITKIRRQVEESKTAEDLAGF